MREKIVILGNQFICEKRICNIVQKTISIESSEVENYLHLHKFFKDQRAIVVDDTVTVGAGYIFNGAEFVNPITLARHPINGEVVEEELDTDGSITQDDVIERFDSIANTLQTLINALIDKERK